MMCTVVHGSIGVKETTVQRVQLALVRGTPGWPTGPALGTGVPAVGLALDGTVALAGNGHWSADRKPTTCPFLVPEPLKNDSNRG